MTVDRAISCDPFVTCDADGLENLQMTYDGQTYSLTSCMHHAMLASYVLVRVATRISYARYYALPGVSYHRPTVTYAIRNTKNQES